MHTTLGNVVAKAFAIAAVAMILTIPGWSQATERILYSFTNTTDGGHPRAGLIMDSKGNLFGTTSQGGTAPPCACGTVFKLTPGSNGTWTESVIHSFGSSSTDGNNPSSSLIFDPKGNLYGMTLFGGTWSQGTVYELSPAADGTWTETIVYNFTGGEDGGSIAGSRLTIDNAGNLYGVTNGGGTFGFGVVFQLVPGKNGTWTEKVLHSFTGDDDGYQAY